MTSDSDDDDMPLAAMATNGSKKKKSSTKKKTPTKKKTATKRKREDAKPDKVTSTSAKKAKKTTTPAKKPVKKELKKLDKAERLQYAMQSFLWWNAKDPPEGCQWEKMEHAGVSFPEPYQPHRVRMKYDGKPIDLTPLQEEA